MSPPWHHCAFPSWLPQLGHAPLRKQLPSVPLQCVVVLTILYLHTYIPSLFVLVSPYELSPSTRAAARYFLVSVAAHTAAVWVAGVLPGPRRAAAWGLLLAVPWLLLAYSHGTSYSDHGMFNFVAFWMLALPVHLVLAAGWAAHRAFPNKHHLPWCLLAAALCLGLAVLASLRRHARQSAVGFLGRELEQGCRGARCSPGSQPLCNFPPNLPWVDLLPSGIWASHQCQAVHGFQARLDQASGLLTITGCSKEAGYTVLPPIPRRYEAARTAELARSYTPLLQRRRYAGPVRLAGAEAVLAACGSTERLLVRVAANMTAARAPGLQPLAMPARSPAPEASPTAPGSGSSGGPPSEQPLSVLFILLDALQRQHLFRRMPHTVAALEQLHSRNTTRLYQFFRHHVVGINSAANTRPMFAGIPRRRRGAQPVWEAFRRVGGHILGSAQNQCELWGPHYNGKRTLFEHELIAPWCLREYQTVGTNEPGLFKGPYSILPRCLRGRPAHAPMFDYMRSFLAAYGGGASPFFFSSTFVEAHEPTGEVIATLDADLAVFLLGLSPGVLNRTAVVLVADHGLHMGLNFLYTANGKVEHANPFLVMLLPTWLRQRHPAAADALRRNEQRLVTAYDLHTTLHHLLHLGEQAPDAPPPSPQTLAQWGRAGGLPPYVRWGLSLLAPIPANRTCGEAGVPPEWCMCKPPAG